MKTFAGIQNKNTAMRELLAKPNAIDCRPGAKSMLLWEGKHKTEIDHFLNELFQDPQKVRVLIARRIIQMFDEETEVKPIYSQGNC